MVFCPADGRLLSDAPSPPAASGEAAGDRLVSGGLTDVLTAEVDVSEAEIAKTLGLDGARGGEREDETRGDPSEVGKMFHLYEIPCSEIWPPSYTERIGEYNRKIGRLGNSPGVRTAPDPAGLEASRRSATVAVKLRPRLADANTLRCESIHCAGDLAR